jgi:hypothetical protein
MMPATFFSWKNHPTLSRENSAALATRQLNNYGGRQGFLVLRRLIAD